MRSCLLWLIVIGILIALLGFLVIFNDVLKIPLIDFFKGYEGWFIAIGLLIAVVLAILFFSDKPRKK